MLVLPQILLGLVLAVNSLTNPSAWHGAATRLWTTIRTKPIKAGAWLCVVIAAAWLIWWLLIPVQSSTVGSSDSLADESWPTFHGNQSRSGMIASPDDDVNLTAQLRWKFHDSLILERRPFACSPAVVGSRALIGSDNYKLYCLDKMTGQLQWTFEAEYPIFSSPAVWNGRVYIGEGLHYDTNTKLYCLDLRNGEVIWTFQTNSHTESSPTVDSGKVYFGAGDDGLYCLDAITGEMQWRFPDAHVDGGPLVVDDYVYFGSGYSYKGVLCVSAGDGQLIWKRDFRAPVWGAPSFAEKRLYIGVGNGNFNESDPTPFGEVRCLSPTDGKDIWRFTDVKDSVLTSVAVSDNLAVFGSRDGACYALDAQNGALVWRTDIGIPIVSSPAIAGHYVLFGADDSKLHCLNLENGQEVWTFDTTDDILIFMETGSIQSSPTVVPGMVIFGASNGNVYCLGGNESETTMIAQTGYRSRLMRAADFLVVGFIKQSAQFTRSYGLAIILMALAVKLFLLPLDWKQMRQSQKMKELQPEIERLRREATDPSIYLSKMRQLYASQGIHPLGVLVAFSIQLPLFIIVFLIMQATPVFAGKPFLWISDLAISDRIAQIPSFPWFGSELHLLPLLLMASVWFFAMTIRGLGQSAGVFGRIIWLLLALGITVLTYRWSSALLLFTIALLWFGIFIQKMFSGIR